MPRPPGIRLSFVEDLQNAVASSTNCLVELEQAGKTQVEKVANKLVRAATELLMRHVQQRMLAGASESEISNELDYLLRVVNARHTSGDAC